jgi:hypothetical protein
MGAGSRADGGRRPRSAARHFMLRGVVAGGAVGVLLMIGVELGSLVLTYGGVDFGSGSMATFLWVIFLMDYGLRGLVFGLVIGTLTAAVALLTRQRLPIATRSRRVLAVGVVSGVSSAALAWVPAHWAATSGLTAGEFAYPVVAAIVSGLVAAATEHRFESPTRDGRACAR